MYHMSRTKQDRKKKQTKLVFLLGEDYFDMLNMKSKFKNTDAKLSFTPETAKY